MIRHVCTLIWHRKKANALIMLELLVTFLILFALSGFSLYFYHLYTRPLGFRVENTWLVKIATGSNSWTAENDVTFNQILDVVRELDGVSRAEVMFNQPFEIGGSASSFSVGDVYMQYVELNTVSPGFPEVVGMHLVQGRWFGPQDQVTGVDAIKPVLVNRAFRDTVGRDVIGTDLPWGSSGSLRIVGVFDDFRQHGKFSPTTPFMLQMTAPDGSYRQAPNLVLLLNPGIAPDFEEGLFGVLQRLAPEWDFAADSFESMQRKYARLTIVPLLIASVLVLFLLVMVGFGMLGVLWQNIIRRTPEMGLRRAMGARASSVRLQVVLELLTAACFALVPGLVIVIQLPLTGVLSAMDWDLFFPAAFTSTIVLLGLCIIFALYPSFQATRNDPVEALRYE